MSRVHIVSVRITGGAIAPASDGGGSCATPALLRTGEERAGGDDAAVGGGFRDGGARHHRRQVLHVNAPNARPPHQTAAVATPAPPPLSPVKIAMALFAIVLP